MSKSPLTQIPGNTSGNSAKSTKTPEQKAKEAARVRQYREKKAQEGVSLSIPEFGAALFLLGRQFRKHPGYFNAGDIFKQYPDNKGGIWTVGEMERGIRITYDGNFQQGGAGEIERLRHQSRQSSISAHRKALLHNINQRKGHISNAEVEIEAISRMIKDPVHTEDANLPIKLAQIREQKLAMERAVAYWENELEPIEKEFQEIDGMIAAARAKEDSRYTQTWELADSQKIEVLIAHVD